MNEPAKSSSGIAGSQARRKTSASNKGVSSRGISSNQLSPELLQKMDAWWRAANYLNIGQIYLMANPLLKEPLKTEHIKPRLLGHWGTSPGLNLVYVHLNRLINQYDLNVVYMAGQNIFRTLLKIRKGCLSFSASFLPLVVFLAM